MNAQNTNASTILDALLAAEDKSHTLTDLAKAAECSNDEAKAALALLIGEGSAQKVGRRFQVVTDEAPEPTADGDDSIGADEAAILAAEGMLGDDVEVPAEPSEPVAEKARRKVSPSHYVAKVAYDMAVEMADEMGVTSSDERPDFITGQVRKALQRLEDGDAAKVIKKALSKLIGESPELIDILKALSAEFKPSAGKGSAGPRVPAVALGTVTEPTVKTRLKRGDVPYLSIRMRREIAVKGDVWTIVEDTDEAGNPRITATKVASRPAS